jgi:hypothetical protein
LWAVESRLVQERCIRRGTILWDPSCDLNHKIKYKWNFSNPTNDAQWTVITEFSNVSSCKPTLPIDLNEIFIGLFIVLVVSKSDIVTMNKYFALCFFVERRISSYNLLMRFPFPQK